MLPPTNRSSTTHRDLVEGEGGEVGIEEESLGVDVDGRLSTTVPAHPPGGVDDAPEPWPGYTIVGPPLTPVYSRGITG